MTLPTGGQVTYGYTNTTPPNQINRWLTSRTVDGNTWTFSPTIVCTTPSCTNPGDGLHVTVTTPPYNDATTTASDTRVYSFFFASPNGGGGAWPTQVQYFRGAASGTPLLTASKEYNNGQNNTCTLPMGNALTPVLIRETITWPAASGTLSKKIEYCYDSLGVNLITKKTWDYQPNGNFAAAPDREVDNIYVTDPAYINANILTLLQSSTTKNGGVTQVAQTTYAYDEGSLQASGVTTSHTTPTGPRANLTSLSRWLNTTGSNVTNQVVWTQAKSTRLLTLSRIRQLSTMTRRWAVLTQSNRATPCLRLSVPLPGMIPILDSVQVPRMRMAHRSATQRTLQHTHTTPYFGRCAQTHRTAVRHA